MTLNDKKGKPQTVKAKYVVVWGKQLGGSWKTWSIRQRRPHSE